MTELEQLRRALRRIADYDARKAEGYLDEWQGAAAFGACQEIARNALEPGRAARLQAEARRERQIVRARKRELLRGIGADERHFYRDHGFHGVFVRVLPRSVESEDLVWVKVTKVVGQPSSHLCMHHEFTVNTANLITEGRALDLLGQAPPPPPAPPDPRLVRLSEAIGDTMRKLTGAGVRLSRAPEALEFLSAELSRALRGAEVELTVEDDGNIRVHALGVSRLL